MRARNNSDSCWPMGRTSFSNASQMLLALHIWMCPRSASGEALIRGNKCEATDTTRRGQRKQHVRNNALAENRCRNRVQTSAAMSRHVWLAQRVGVCPSELIDCLTWIADGTQNRPASGTGDTASQKHVVGVVEILGLVHENQRVLVAVGYVVVQAVVYAIFLVKHRSILQRGVQQGLGHRASRTVLSKRFWFHGRSIGHGNIA